MNTNKLILLVAIAMTTLSGCSIQPIGKEDFTCGSLKKGGVCAGPRDIYELTNDRDSLQDLTIEELEAQKIGQPVGHSVAVNPKNKVEVKSTESNTVYEPRTNEQQSLDSYQAAKVIPQTRFDSKGRDSFDAWPNNGEPLAPEALAVMTEPKAMRVMVTAWKDEKGFLNLPGYLYVDVQDKTWKYGEAANLRPTRVVPLSMSQETQENIRERKHKKRGVSPLEVSEGQ
jgi:conjugal transfer pilus assembly protein TraV